MLLSFLARFRRCGPLLFVATVLIAPASATIIVASWSKSRVIIGADGMQIDPNFPGRHVPVCKIQEVGDCFVAAAGLIDYEPTNFHLKRIVTNACGVRGDLSKKVRAFEAESNRSISRTVSYAHEHSPSDYELMTAYGSVKIDVVFAGWEHGRKALALVSYDDRGTGVMRKAPMNLLSDAPGAVGQVYVIGASLSIQDYKKLRPEITGLNDLHLTHALLQAAIDAEQNDPLSPKTAGPPVSILEISDIGARWIERGQCMPRE